MPPTVGQCLEHLFLPHAGTNQRLVDSSYTLDCSAPVTVSVVLLLTLVVATTPHSLAIPSNRFCKLLLPCRPKNMLQTNAADYSCWSYQTMAGLWLLFIAASCTMTAPMHLKNAITCLLMLMYYKTSHKSS